MDNQSKKTQKIILYIMNRLGSNVEGKKKIMKLMFLLEHFDVDQTKLVKKQFLGNLFFIYNYGVFSREVMDSYNNLIKKGYIKDGFPLRTSKQYSISLDETTKEKVDKIVEMFGDKKGYTLEVDTLEMVGIKPYEKGKFFGNNIDTLIKS